MMVVLPTEGEDMQIVRRELTRYMTRVALTLALLSAAVVAGGATQAEAETYAFCPEVTCTLVQDAYISHFTGSNCTGVESYYTHYFNSDGIRRSWDGTGFYGSQILTITNRSWRGANGSCHNDWPNGNTLSGFVRIYRDTSAVGVEGGYISHFTGADCTGVESYYTHYFNSDGIRRSWDGHGIAGTIDYTATNRSWKGYDGRCHNDWPNGNTLSGFVRIYRVAVVF